jgi:hypothetical protein
MDFSSIERNICDEILNSSHSDLEDNLSEVSTEETTA